MLIVKSAVKQMCHPINIGGDFLEALDKKVEALVKEANQRAQSNGRRTIMAKDI